MIKQRRVLILFGGRSGEHEVSIVSAASVFRSIDRSKFEPILVGVDKKGRWFLADEAKLLLQSSNPKLVSLNATNQAVSLLPSENKGRLLPVSSQDSAIKPNALVSDLQCDIVFPVLHGPNGEDGTMQGFLELANLPYVGSGVLGSAVCMDKELAKRLLQHAGIPVVPWLTGFRSTFEVAPMTLVMKAEETFGYPYFVKPANMGSSVGVSKVKSRAEAEFQIKEAFRYDTKVLFERAIVARELECAVLGNENPKASIVGEIVPHGDFYSYEAKYVDEQGASLLVPAADLQPSQIEEIQRLSIMAFKALECAGLARVDFFMDKSTSKLYLNEINTIPGFTPISMYPKLWEASGISYTELISRLLDLAVERFQQRQKN